MLEVSIKQHKKFCFVSKLVSYDMGISCKGPISTALYVHCYPGNQSYVFQTTACGCLRSDGHSTGVTEGVGVYVNISPFEQ